MNLLKSIIVISAFSAMVISCSTGSNVKTNGGVENVAPRSSANAGANRVRADRTGVVDEAVAVENSGDGLYAQNCMICHKDTGKGGKMTIQGKTINPEDLTSAKIKAKSDEKLLVEIKNGFPDEGMPAFKGKLSDEEIKSIIQKIRKF